MTSSTISLTISIVMITLFSIAVIGFSISFANDNDADISIADNEQVMETYTSNPDTMSDFKDKSEDTYTSILDTTVEPGSDVIPSSAPFSLTTSSLLTALGNTLSIPVTFIFGGFGSPFGIFFTILISVISLMFILYVIKTWKGNP